MESRADTAAAVPPTVRGVAVVVAEVDPTAVESEVTAAISVDGVVVEEGSVVARVKVHRQHPREASHSWPPSLPSSYLIPFVFRC